MPSTFWDLHENFNFLCLSNRWWGHFIYLFFLVVCSFWCDSFFFFPLISHLVKCKKTKKNQENSCKFSPENFSVYKKKAYKRKYAITKNCFLVQCRPSLSNWKTLYSNFNHWSFELNSVLLRIHKFNFIISSFQFLFLKIEWLLLLFVAFGYEWV